MVEIANHTVMTVQSENTHAQIIMPLCRGFGLLIEHIPLGQVSELSCTLTSQNLVDVSLLLLVKPDQLQCRGLLLSTLFKIRGKEGMLNTIRHRSMQAERFGG